MNIKRYNRGLRTLVTAAFGVGVTITATAQGTGNSSSVNVLEEITVTAQKRSQSLQDVPISVSALSGERIEGLHLVSSRDLAQHIPGLESGGTANFTKPHVFLRGIGSTAFRDNEQSPIAIYFDEVFQGSSVNSFAQLMDLERVEVLKGPQGTLWGRNATGGLINYITRKPEVDDETNGYLNATVADFGEFSAEGAVTIPMSDKVAGRIAVRHSQRDGPFAAVGPTFQGDFGGWEWTSLRAQLVFEATDRLTIRPKITYSKIEADPINGGKNYGLFTPGAFDFGGTPCPGANTLGANCGDLLDNTGFNASIGIPNASVSNGNFDETEVSFRGFENNDSVSFSVNSDYDLDNYTFTAILAHSSFERQYHADLDFTLSPFAESIRETEFESSSAEFRLTNDDANRLRWTLGAYFYSDELDASVCDPFDPFGLAFGAPLPPNCVATVTNIEGETAAIFVDGTYELTDRLSLTAGFRYTYDKREGRGQGFNFQVPALGQFLSVDTILAGRVNPFLVDQSSGESWNEPTGRLTLSYQASDDILFYGGWARGFKGGDYSGAELVAASDFTPADPEFADNIEIGMKSQWMDDSLRANVSAFYTDFSDKQVLSETLVNGLLVASLNNAGQLEITGLEAEFLWLPTENLNVALNMSYLDSEFKDLSFTSFGFFTDLAGVTTAYTPEFSFNGSIGHQWPVSSGGAIHSQLTVSWSDDIFFELDNNPISGRDSLTLVDVSIGYTSANEQWDFTLWAKNLTDEEYFSGGFELDFAGVNLQNIADPRVVGASVRYNF